MAKKATKPSTSTAKSKPTQTAAIKTADKQEKSAGVGAIAKASAEAKSAAPATTTTTTTANAAPKAAEAKTKAPERKFCDIAAITTQKFTANQNSLKAKKVAEKVKNAVAAIEQGKKLSKYTRSALTMLKSGGEVTGPSITKQFEADGLSPGTARAQAQQQTALFKVIGVAKPTGDNGRTLVTDDLKLIDALLATSV